MLFFELNCVQQHGEELENTAQHHKNVEHRVHPFFSAADAVEYRTDGVGDAAQQEKQEAGQGQHLQGLTGKGNDSPPKADIADHGNDIVFLQVNGSEGGSKSCHCPLEDEQAPAKCRIPGAESGQYDDGVGPRNEEIDGAVVNDLHHFLSHAGL